MTAEGEFALVRQHLEEGLKQTSEWVGDHDCYAMLSDIAARQRDAAALQYYTPLAEELAVRYGHTLYQGIAHRAWGVAHHLAGDREQAESRLNRALELFVSLNARWQIGRTWYELGESARAQQNAEAARDRYQRAIAAFEELGANPDVQQTRAALAELG